MWTLTCKTHVKVIWSMNTWNDPTVITEMLPPTVSPKSIMKLEFLTEVFIFNLPKIWGSVLGQCSIIWTSVCSKFDDSSIRTGLERSQGLRKSCFSGKSCAHIVFLLFVRSTNSHSGDLRHLRQPASNDKQPFGRSAAPTIWIASAISIFKMYTVCLWLRRLHVLDPVWSRIVPCSRWVCRETEQLSFTKTTHASRKTSEAMLSRARLSLGFMPRELQKTKLRKLS
jgi:hypothetical protein